MAYISTAEYNKNPELHKKRLSQSITWITKEDYIYNFLEKQGRDASILDIGSGSGYFLDNLKKRNFHNIVGADINNYLNNPTHKFVKIDLNTKELPFSDNTFSIVTAFQMIEHLENYFLIATEAARVLKPNGLFIFSVPNQFNFFYRVKFAITGDMPGWTRQNNHLLFITKSVFEKTYLKYFNLEGKHYRRGLIPMFGRVTTLLNKMLKLNINHKLRVLPRSEIWSDDTCYILRKK